ncbi:MAG: YegS/Rv2252/BmrU family lipid kinase [Lachnospiraceae bacterium]|nr:YegS/Rv2252/BmrU family lipid kinase [Lachnospiraceae bacterium]
MYHIIINPNCGSGKGRRNARELSSLMNRSKKTYIEHFCKNASDVTKYTASVTDPRNFENNAVANRLILIGGDGTLNNCINGIKDLEHTTLTYLPSGTSNDFSRSLHISGKPLRALRATSPKIRTKSMDLATVSYGTKKRRFVVSSGIGYDAAVCQEVQHSPLKAAFNRFRLGKLIYGFIALKQFLFLKPCGCDLYLDDSEEPIHFNTFLLAAFMNLKHEGGGFPFAPDADPADGKLDICLVGNLSKAMVPFVLPFVLAGRHHGKPGVHSYRASKIRIVTEEPLYAHTDGEILGKYKELSFVCGQEKLLYR